MSHPTDVHSIRLKVLYILYVEPLPLEMEVEVVAEEKNPFLDRVEIELRVRHVGEPTPSRKAILQYLRDTMGLDPKKTVVASLETETGMNYTRVLVYYYPEGIDWSTIEPSKRWKVVELGEEESQA